MAKFTDGRASYFGYSLEGGVASELVEDRVFFQSEVVSWIVQIVADRDGQMHTLQEAVDILGPTLDSIYVNNDYVPGRGQYDVLVGPDQIYVWAECGVAISAAWDSATAYFPGLQIRHPTNLESALRPTPDIGAEMLFMFLFPPTSFDGFVSHYQDKIPFLDGAWLEYFRRVNR